MRKLFVTALLSVAIIGCKKKGGGGGGDIKSMCEANFAHGEMSDGKWSPGKGDKAAFMDYCVKQDKDVVRCSSMEIEMGDKSCEKHTGVGADGFKVKMEISRLRNEPAAGGGAGGTTSGKPVEGGDTAANEPPPEPQPACAADAYKHETEPKFCLNLGKDFKPDGNGEQKRGDQTALVFEGPNFATVQVLYGTTTEANAIRDMKQAIDFSQKGDDAAPLVAKGPWHGGYYFHTKTKGMSPDIHNWQYITTGPAGSLKCLGSGNEGDPASRDAVEAACKSLQFQ